MAETFSNEQTGSDVLEQAYLKKQRKLIMRRIKSCKKFIEDKHKHETRHYIRAYRHEFEGILPERLLNMDDVDVNVVFPIIKTLIPSLYFQDPRVLAKSDMEKIVRPVVDPVTGMLVLDPETGQPIVDEYDGPRSALIFQNALNTNMREAGLKKEVKSAILDAHICFYGALKLGWGNPQGVASMGEGAPPHARDNVLDGMAHGIRLKPWEVYPDMNDFYHPEWVAIRYCVHPEQLKQDKRLRNTEKVEGKAEMEEDKRREVYSAMDKEDLRMVEYFEYYHLPCAAYPQGVYALLTEEVADDFLYYGPWPYAVQELPVKFLWFNEDPEGGLPIPDIRYYIQQQKAKSNLRRVMYEYVQRTVPVMGIDVTKVRDETQKQQITSGQVPRVVGTNGNPNAALGATSFANLNQDFQNMDILLDNDTTRVVGLLTAGGQDKAEFAAEAERSAKGEAVRTNERADTLRDFMRGVIKFWAKLYQEFAGEENYTPIEGEKFPIKWSVEEIQGPFRFDIQPFSMNYEDPTIRRRQFVDLLNLLSSPELRGALNMQGADIDYLKVINRVLETYDERDVESFVIDQAAKPENQVAKALMEIQETAQGIPPQVAPTDNDKLHIMIHQAVGNVIGVDMSEHILAHQQNMMNKMAGTPGGGNVGGMPVNGVAANQEMMRQPVKPSAQNAANAQSAKATSER